jgi:hypothetical protein
VAVLLTVCCVVFWRMTRPVPLAVSRPLRPPADGGAPVGRPNPSGASNAATRSRRSGPSRQSRRAARRASS